MQDSTPNEHVWLMQMLDNLGAKLNFIFLAPTLCPKHVPSSLTVPLADALHCYVFAPVFNFFMSESRVFSLRNCWLWTEK